MKRNKNLTSVPDGDIHHAAAVLVARVEANIGLSVEQVTVTRGPRGFEVKYVVRTEGTIEP